MTELFVFGSFAFWALVVIEIILLFIFMDFENGFGAFMSLIGFVVLLQWFGNVDLIGFCVQKPVLAISSLATYFVFGALWGVLKWKWYCDDCLAEYQEFKVEFLTENKVDPSTKVIPLELRSKWARSLETKKYDINRNLAEMPSVRKNKAKIIRWMSLFVISFIWTFIEDFVVRIFKKIYQKISGFLHSIAVKTWQRESINEDLNIPD